MKAVLMVVTDGDLRMGRNTSAKGSLLMARADGTAVSLEQLHETGSEKGEVCLRYTDAAHRHATSKYKHSTVQISLGQTRLTFQAMKTWPLHLVLDNLQCCASLEITFLEVPEWTAASHLYRH